MRVGIRRADEFGSAHRRAIREADLGALLRRCGPALGVPARSSLTVRLTDDEELRALSERFLQIDAPTDVLAFPSDEPGRVGDVAISVERAVEQGADRPAEELRLLAVHGLLHCLGHDHGAAAEARAMTAMTRRLLPDQEVPDLVPAAG